MPGRITLCLVCLIGLAQVAGAADPEAPIIDDAEGRFRATVIPLHDWCSAVVSVDIQSSPGAFEKYPEEVQEFVGAIRSAVDAECPIVEMIRMRGLVDGASVFRGYTAKQSGWRIQIFSANAAILPMLQAIRSPSDSLRSLAYFETMTQFDRARLPKVTVSSSDLAPGNDHVAWRMDGIDGFDGATYVIEDRSSAFPTLGALADNVVQQQAEECVAANNGSIENSASGEVGPNIQTRSFDCDHGDNRTAYGLVSEKVDDVTTLFLLHSVSRSATDLVEKHLSDKNVVY